MYPLLLLNQGSGGWVLGLQFSVPTQLSKTILGIQKHRKTWLLRPDGRLLPVACSVAETLVESVRDDIVDATTRGLVSRVMPKTLRMPLAGKYAALLESRDEHDRRSAYFANYSCELGVPRDDEGLSEALPLFDYLDEVADTAEKSAGWDNIDV